MTLNKMDIVTIISGKSNYRIELWKLLSKSEMLRSYIIHKSDKDSDLILDLNEFDKKSVEHVYNYFNVNLYTFPTELRKEIYKIADYLMMEDLKLASRETANLFYVDESVFVEELSSDLFDGILEGDIIMKEKTPFAIYYRKKFVVLSTRNSKVYLPEIMEPEIFRKFLPSIWQIPNYKIFVPLFLVSYQTDLYRQIDPYTESSLLTKDVTVILDLEHRKISLLYPKGYHIRYVYKHMDHLTLSYLRIDSSSHDSVFLID